jgi:integrating conjugative element protein (TIGR03749 family)
MSLKVAKERTVTTSAFAAGWNDLRGWLPALFLVLVLLYSSGSYADTAPPERIAWRKAPIAVELPIGVERLVHFPEPVQVGLPPPLQGRLRIQSIAGTLYLLAYQAFEANRVIVRGMDEGRVYLLDLAANDEGRAAALEVYLPGEDQTLGTEREEAPGGPAPYGYVTLTRFAAQELYAPARLLNALPGVVRVPVTREPVVLVRGDSVEAVPLVAWRAGDLYVSAVKLTNSTRGAQTLDPRTLRGHWLAATFQHNRLHEAGSEADRTVVYLISDRPFADALR